MGEITLSESLTLQLSEIEMLTSMYPQKEEFLITDPSVIKDMNDFLNGKTSDIPSQLEYLFCIDIQNVREKIEATVSLPLEYPFVKPMVYVRLPFSDRESQKALNSALSNFVEIQDADELIIGSIFSWLTSNAPNFYSSFLKTCPLPTENHSDDSKLISYCRMWIYSHHIYNKEKRRNIVSLGESYKFTGFSMPGKPGIICVEGFADFCRSFFQELKQMSWKKLTLIEEEECELTEDNVKDWRRFDLFQEVSFQARQGPAREYHMDMGQFQKFLEAHNSGAIFHEIFGLKGSLMNTS